jgi:hypothetical protein
MGFWRQDRVGGTSDGSSGIRHDQPIVAYSFAVVLLGAINAWTLRYAMRSDTVSYLDISDAFLHGDWKAAVRGYWSPLYPWCIGLARRILGTRPEWDFPAAHLVDFSVYLGGLACFHFLLTQLLRYHRLRTAAGKTVLPERCWWLLGYGLYLWSSLDLILRAPAGTPDMLMAAFVYLAAGLLLRIAAGRAGPGTFALLGAAVGFAYLAKTVMFLLAFVFLAVAAVSGGLRRAALALLVFLAIAAPFVVALSGKLGHFSFGESGKLNYVWMVSRVAVYVHWQGGDTNGTPEHATRRISDHPSIYEFGSPISGTYPPWGDPAYWYEGVVMHFRLGQQLRVLVSNVIIYLELFQRQGAVIVSFLTLCFLSRPRKLLREAAAYAALLIPALAALLVYWLVYVEWRHVGAFVVLLWLGLFSALQLPDTPRFRNLMSSLSLATTWFLVLLVGVLTFYQWQQMPPLANNPSWQVARHLERLGLRPGDAVGLVGWGSEAYWARLARLRITTEILDSQAPAFWAAPEPARSRLIRMFASTGVKAIVAERVPNYAPTAGWQNVGPGYYVLLVNQHPPDRP